MNSEVKAKSNNCDRGNGGGSSLNNANKSSATMNSSVKSNSSAGLMKERKSPEDVIFSLRCELRTLYDSLSDKNEQLLTVERDVRDRDISIRFLKSEFKKVLEQQRKNAASNNTTSFTQALSSAGASCKCANCGSMGHCASNSRSTNSKKNSHETVEEHLRGKDLIDKLQLDIKDRDHVIIDLNGKLIKLTEDVSNLQEELVLRNERIVALQNELDKFRQVVRPLTQHMIDMKRRAGRGLQEEYSSGVESTRILPVSNEPRLKRVAISAEPLSLLAGAQQEELVKIPKSSQ